MYFDRLHINRWLVMTILLCATLILLGLGIMDFHSTDQSAAESKENAVHTEAADSPAGEGYMEEAADSAADGIAIKVQASIRLPKDEKPLITWKKVSSAKSYMVQMKDADTGVYADVASFGAVSADDTYKFKASVRMKKGKQRIYRVQAVLEDGTVRNSKALSCKNPLGQVKKLRIKKISSGAVRLRWKKVAGAKCYKIYCGNRKTSTKKKISYKRVGFAKGTSFKKRGLKAGKTYYFYVKACKEKKDAGYDSPSSKKVHTAIQKKDGLTVFAGDSITTGLLSYNMLDKIHIGGKKKVVAAIGLNTMTFRSRRVFSGQTALQKVVASKASYVYLLLGINEIHYRKPKEVIRDYTYLVNTIKKQSPDTKIIILPLAPVTREQRYKRTGFKQIPSYNAKLKKLAKKKGCLYYDYTAPLKGKDGYLQKKYKAGDGVHWNVAGYNIFVKQIQKFHKSL